MLYQRLQGPTKEHPISAQLLQGLKGPTLGYPIRPHYFQGPNGPTCLWEKDPVKAQRVHSQGPKGLTKEEVTTSPHRPLLKTH